VEGGFFQLDHGKKAPLQGFHAGDGPLICSPKTMHPDGDHGRAPRERHPFHVQVARDSGACRDEVVSAILVGLPAAGLGVTQVLPAAIAAYDAA
jgi:hypothetical protein